MLRSNWHTAAAAVALVLVSASIGKAQDLRVLIIPPAPVKDPLMGNIINWSAFENAWVLANPADMPHRIHVPAFIGKRIKGDGCSDCDNGNCGSCKKRRNNCCKSGRSKFGRKKNCCSNGCCGGCAASAAPTPARAPMPATPAVQIHPSNRSALSPPEPGDATPRQPRPIPVSRLKSLRR